MTVISELIRMIAPIDAIITTDDVGCREEVARAVREVPRAECLLALKKNHHKLEAEIVWLFDHHDQGGWIDTDSSFALTQNAGHGRTETRECRLMRDLTVLEQVLDRTDLHAMVLVRATRTRGDQTSVEDRFCLTILQGKPVSGQVSSWALLWPRRRSTLLAFIEAWKMACTGSWT